MSLCTKLHCHCLALIQCIHMPITFYFVASIYNFPNALIYHCLHVAMDQTCWRVARTVGKSKFTSINKGMWSWGIKTRSQGTQSYFRGRVCDSMDSKSV